MAGTPSTPRGMKPPDRKTVRITVPEDRGKPRYGDPFWPKVPFVAIFYISAIFAALIFLAVTNPAPLQNPADPLNHEAIDPKPEWYFMFLFQLLKYFQGPFILVGTAIIPGILTVLLLLLPFYDRNWARKPSHRPVAMVSMTGAMLMIIFLTWGGLGFPTPNFNTTSQTANGPTTGTISPEVSAIFSAHCASCHIQQQFGGLNLASYAGLVKGGSVLSGPVINPGDHAKSYIWQVVQPNQPWPAGSRMPLGGPYLSDAQVKTIADWIDKLPGGGTGASTSSTSTTGATPSSPSSASATPGSTAGTGATPTTTGGSVAAAPSFKSDIEPLLSAHCAACHIQQQLGGLNLGSYDGLVKGGQIVAGSVFKAGDHANSLIWKMVQPTGPWPGSSRMPLGGPYLSDQQIQTIATWIDKGAKNN